MIDKDKVIKGLECCISEQVCKGCPYKENNECENKSYYYSKAIEDALVLLKEKDRKDVCLSVEPTRWSDNNYYCGKCGVKITNAIKIYDGERLLTSHPDCLKPANKWHYCKACGMKVKWDD